MRKAYESLLFSSGNTGLYGADKNVFDDEGNVLVPPGQIVIWDPITKKSLGPGITVADYDKIVISVGVDQYNLKSCFGNELHGYSVDSATAEPSRCGVPQIVDLFYDCVHCDDEMTVNVTVDNNSTKNQFPFNKKATYSSTTKIVCTSCDGCPEDTVDGRAVACGLRANFDEKRLSGLLQRSTFIPAKQNKYPKGFTAHVLYGGEDTSKKTTFVYCINTIKDSCTGDCIKADALLDEVTFDSNTYPLNFTVDPSDPTKTLLVQLQSVVNQINKLLDGNGSAAITKGFGKCCPYRLEVNTCFEDFDLAGLETCENYNPFVTGVAQSVGCKNCGETPSNKTFTWGLRFIADPIEYTCDCSPNLNPVYDKGNRIEVFPTKGFNPGSWAVVNVQEASLPENLGYDWIMRDYKHDKQGRGGNFDNFEWRGYGELGTPLKRGRSGSIKAKCAETYCSYVIEHALPNREMSAHGHYNSTKGRTIVLIPTADSVTRSEFEAVINPYITSDGCPIKVEMLCSSDQDQAPLS